VPRGRSAAGQGDGEATDRTHQPGMQMQRGDQHRDGVERGGETYRGQREQIDDRRRREADPAEE
jgi:hypothetical protein